VRMRGGGVEQQHARQRWERRDVIAAVFVCATLSIAYVVEDVGFIAAVSGAIVSGSIIWIFPTIMHMRTIAIQRHQCSGWDGGTRAVQAARQWWSSFAICVMGGAMLVLGLANIFGML
jgi:hypothetical protein